MGVERPPAGRDRGLGRAGSEFAALRALATEGIQHGHMGLHARQVAVAAGAQGEMVDRLAQLLLEDGHDSPRPREQLLRDMEDNASRGSPPA